MEADPDRYCDEVMFGKDQLYKFTAREVQLMPHKHIGALTFHNKFNQLGKGSGFLVSSNLVLTAAHNLYKFETRQHYSELMFYPGLDGTLRNGIEIQYYFIPELYYKSPSVSNDYALLKLKTKVNIGDKFMPLGCRMEQINNQTKLLICGYPGSVYRIVDFQTNELSTNQYGLSGIGKVLEINQKKAYIKHLISTQLGQSGSPIIQNQKGNLKVVGIHKGGIFLKNNEIKKWGIEQANTGRLFTLELIKQLKLEAQKMKGEMFHVEGEKSVGSEKEEGNKIDDSIQKYKNDIQTDPEASPSYHELASILNQINTKWKINETTRFVKEIVKKYKNSIKVFMNAGYFFEQLDQDEEAVKFFEGAIKFDQKNQKVLVRLVILLTGIDYQRALDYLKKLLSMNAKNGEYWMLFSDLRNNLEQKDEEKLIKKIISLNPKEKHMFCHIGVMYQSVGQRDKAIQFIKKAIAIDSQFGEAHHQLGQIYEDNEQPEDAMKSYEKWVSCAPNSSEAHQKLGSMFNLLGKYDEAADCYQKALQIKPDNYDAIVELAQTYLNMYKYKEAVMMCKRVIEMDTQRPLGYCILGDVHKEKEEDDKAVECYQKVIEVDPEQVLGYQRLGKLFQRRKKYEEAILWNRKVLTLNSKHHHRALGKIGNIYKDMKKYEESILNYQAAIECSPKNYGFYFKDLILAHKYLGDNNSIKNSITILQKLNRSNTKNPIKTLNALMSGKK